MARYIDADKVINNLPDDLPYKASVKRALIQAPEADVVEVVRCSECEDNDVCWQKVDCGYKYKDIVYCSQGEKKNEM